MIVILKIKAFKINIITNYEYVDKVSTLIISLQTNAMSRISVILSYGHMQFT